MSSVAKKSSVKPRVVPAFTVQSQQRNTVTARPPHTDVFKPELKPSGKTTLFRKLYDRGDFPIQLEHIVRGIRLQWKIPTDQVDVGKLLPIFLEGLLSPD